MLSAGEFPVYVHSPDTSLTQNIQTEQKKRSLGIKTRFLVPILAPSTPSHSNLICAPVFSNLKKSQPKQMKNETGRKAKKFHLCLPSEAVLVNIHLQLPNAKHPRACVCGPTFGKLSLPHEQDCLETGKLPSKLFSMYSAALYLQPQHYKNKNFHS